MQAQPTIAVVGGSLTGPALALLLVKQGFEDVNVFESAGAAQSRAGGVLGLDLQSLAVLDSIGIGQDEVVPFTSERVVSVKYVDRHEEGRVQRLYPGRNSTWSMLHQALDSRLPAGMLQPGHKVVGLDGTELQFSDGSASLADLVVFADGRGSTGRKLLQPKRTLSYSGVFAHRGQVAYDPEQIRDFVRFIPPTGTQLNVFPVFTAEGLGLDWTFYERATTEQFRQWFGGSPTSRMFVLPHQITDEGREQADEAVDRVFPPMIADIVHKTGSHARQAVPLLDIDPPRRMTNGSSMLIGDALAPVYPHTARGLNNGLDQAFTLATTLGQLRKYGGDVPTGLKGWEAKQLPRVRDTLELGKKLVGEAGL
jgi:2-polyprenyl-6-methoxyphenol hydroxylase-like FAD-dependent oxidoreductase